MGDKLANVLIIFIMIVILGLGAIYYTKVVGSYNYAVENSTSYSKMIENSLDEDINTGNYSEENKNKIDMGIDNSANIYSTNNNESGYKYNNRYYYNSLNSESKAIYDAIVNNIDKLKTGNAKIDIDYDFNALLNNENGQKLLGNYYEDVINAINLDVPNLFYLDFSKMSLNIESKSSLFSTKYKLFIDSGENENYFSNGFTSNTQVEVANSQVEIAKNQVKRSITGTDYDKVRTLHDWLIEYMSYESYSSNKASVYGALVEKKGVCESYARTYKYILDELGIENILVVGTATNSTGVTEDHMWNNVKLNGKWYAIDPTWDDPLMLGGGTPSEETKHRYFLKGSRDFYKNHEEKFTISPTRQSV